MPVAVQVGTVAALFAASLGTLAFTGASVVHREGRRASAQETLARAGIELAGRGAGALATVRPWPSMTVDEWDALNRRLTTGAAEGLRRFDGVEGGYFVLDGRRFLGAAFPAEPRGPAAKAKKAGHRRSSDPPPLEYDLIETQVDASIRKGKTIFVVQAVPPSTVAISTAPVMVDGRKIAATWTMTRLVDPAFLDRSIRGYGLAALLALGGIALALALTVGLARSLRRAAAERNRLQVELRRSERLAALGKLLAGVAHEVRNPLAGIRSTAQLWQRGIGHDAEACAGLMDEVDRLEGIVSSLLHFSRADAQDLSSGDLNAVVAEAARLAEVRACEQGVRVETDLARDLPTAAIASPALMQVFRNLTTNALQAMPQGGILRLSTRLDRDRHSVEVRVTDTGIGMSEDALAHLFEPFFTTKAEGTGLGLAIAREIALAHSGDLHASNSPDGRGALFTLTLPAETAEESR